VPYSDLTAIEVLRVVAAGRRLDRPSPTTYELVYDLMRTCMKRDPADRPTMYEAYQKLAQVCQDKEDETEM
jgi:serine/threonine protein kinase